MSQPIFTDGLGYEGKVTLTLKSQGLILESKSYKNSGTAKLFKFLGNCLIGDYSQETKKLAPAKIMLLHNTEDYPNAARATRVEQRSYWQTLSQQPTLISDNDHAQVKVIYSFEVPKVAIVQQTFNQVALYSAGATDFTDFSAYYFLTDESGLFANQNTADWTSSTVLLIEWELTLSNKNTIINSMEGV